MQLVVMQKLEHYLPATEIGAALCEMRLYHKSASKWSKKQDAIEGLEKLFPTDGPEE